MRVTITTHKYSEIMQTEPDLPGNLLSRDVDAIGPQGEVEQRLYDFVMEGLNGPPAIQTTVTELIGELRARIYSRS
jgi:hypothetical protein